MIKRTLKVMWRDLIPVLGLILIIVLISAPGLVVAFVYNEPGWFLLTTLGIVVAIAFVGWVHDCYKRGKRSAR